MLKDKANDLLLKLKNYIYEQMYFLYFYSSKLNFTNILKLIPFNLDFRNIDL